MVLLVARDRSTIVQYRIKRYKASLFYITSTRRINISVFNVAPKEYRVFFLRDVTAAVLVFLNKGTAAMLVYPTNSPGIELYSNAKVLFCKKNTLINHVSENIL